MKVGLVSGGAISVSLAKRNITGGKGGYLHLGHFILIYGWEFPEILETFHL